jgi:hypothetical protein
LPERDLLTYRSLIFQLLHVGQTAGRFDDEREVWRRLESLEGLAESGNNRNLITNHGLERAPMSERYRLLADPPTGFDWVIRPHREVRARRDNASSHSGAYALHLTFAAPMRSEFREVTQLIAVEPLTAYRLSYFVKTERLPAAPFIELVDAARPELFALRSIVPGGTNDWREVTLNFTTPPGTRGLRLAICSPVLMEFNSANVGELWFDDFKLEKAE